MHPPPATFLETGPTGPLSLDSAFYIERPPVETFAYAAIARPGSLLRIKAPKQMGKSSLLMRVIEQAHQQGAKTGKIDFLQAEKTCFASLDTLLRWFCHLTARQLGIAPNLDDWWDEEIGSKVSCTLYFENHLLRRLDTPLVLVINEINRVFEHEEVAGDFLSLLRFWHEQGQRSPVWQNLRLVLAYCTEVYVPLQLEQSPFNVGQQLKLPPFTTAQVQELAARYQVPQQLGEAYVPFIDELMSLVGGHPYLTHAVLAQVPDTAADPQDLLNQAMQPSGVWGEYLRRGYASVRHQPDLIDTLQQLVKAPHGLKLPLHLAYQLENVGLVHYDGDRYRLSCELFKRFLVAELAGPEAPAPIQLQQENQRLKQLAHTDALTQIPNRLAFDIRLQIAWQRMSQTQEPLTLMMCDIDYFKAYNDNYGHLAGDQCLRQVASILQAQMGTAPDFVARFGGEEFAVILPRTDLLTAEKRAETLRSQISLQTAQGEMPPVTISIGGAVASTPTNQSTRQLIEAADRVLYESKRLGRDRVTIISLL
ncbi:AAA-like domain-containing protein [Leptolyngbya iicbica]|uniref:AAA-like domain-containing protein n=1 Tax=Leptolyngbya iicbica TaxID=3161580 RepID=UPI00058569BB|nr:AAA-like domain-containing protein [Leptolyngbya sp. LK]